jgi:hypothetical protein
MFPPDAGRYGVHLTHAGGLHACEKPSSELCGD